MLHGQRIAAAQLTPGEQAVASSGAAGAAVAA
jgi:hypothetical protein